MPETGRLLDSLRPSRIDGERIAIALAISIAVHIIGFGGYEIGKAAVKISPWLRALVRTKVAPKPVPPQVEEPIQFVMVNQPATEAPKNAKYYSSQNARAANPEAEKDTETPKLNGTQTEIAKVDDTARTKLQPAPTQPEQPKSMAPGDLILGKSQNQNQKPSQEQRPRKLQEVLAQRHMAGPQMHQNGGVQDKRLVASFDAKATPFGAYDQRIVEAVTQRWYDLLDSRNFALDRVGKVTVRFHLNYDGSVTEMQILDSNVGDLLSLVCRDAIEQAAPFGAWPGDMRRMVAMNYREITFTFYYY